MGKPLGVPVISNRRRKPVKRLFAACGFTQSWQIAMVMLALLVSSPRALAHDLGAMSVACTFNRDGSYVVHIAIDREHLPPAMKSIDDQRLTSQFIDQAQFRFDGVI